MRPPVLVSVSLVISALTLLAGMSSLQFAGGAPVQAASQNDGTRGGASATNSPAELSRGSQADSLAKASNETSQQAAAIEALALAWLKRPELQHSLVGLEIMHLPSAQVIFSHNGNKRFVPASTTKVFTTACASDMFGLDFRFKTRLLAYGENKGGTLHGGLFVEPSQDPTLKTADLKNLLQSTKSRQINKVDGSFGISAVEGGGDRFSTYWLLEDWGQDWMPVSSDLVLDSNIARRDPGRGYPLVSTTGSPSENAIVSTLLSAPSGPSWVCYNPAAEKVFFYHPRGPMVGGQIVGNPEQYNLAAAKNILSSLGVKVRETKPDIKVYQESPILIGEHQSEPLSKIVSHCLKESDNLYAQQLLRLIGTQPAVSRQVDKATLEERGLARLDRWLGAMGVRAGDVVLFDGCGLSRKNCFTPHALNLVHRYMAQNCPQYQDLMPLDGAGAGVNGTFRYKTGAMDSVRSISGVLRTAAGEPLALTIMVNAHSPSIRDVRASMASLIDKLQSLGVMRYQAKQIGKAVVPVGGARVVGKKTSRGTRAAHSGSSRALVRGTKRLKSKRAAAKSKYRSGVKNGKN